jgi:hypothetical protein
MKKMLLVSGHRDYVKPFINHLLVHLFSLGLTSILEIAIGIIAASLSTLRPLLRNISQQIRRSEGSSGVSNQVLEIEREDTNSLAPGFGRISNISQVKKS